MAAEFETRARKFSLAWKIHPPFENASKMTIRSFEAFFALFRIRRSFLTDSINFYTDETSLDLVHPCTVDKLLEIRSILFTCI